MRFLVFFILITTTALLFGGKPEKSLIIVTTNKIKHESEKLYEFIHQKEIRGYNVLLATEDQYKPGNLKGQNRALKIRQYLKSISKDYTYLLIIGNAHPEHGLDNKGDDSIFEYQLITGRIDVHFGEVEDVDIILGNAIKYMNADREQLKLRKKILFPMSFVYFNGENMVGGTTYGHYGDDMVSEWIIHNILYDLDFTYTTMYEKEGYVISEYESDIPLTMENLNKEWEKGQGIIIWGGHGVEKGAFRTVWAEDKNGDEKIDADEKDTPFFVTSESVKTFKSANPAFIYPSSCEIGSVETPDNLAHNMLLSNNAIGILGSTSATSSSLTEWKDLASEIDRKTPDISCIAALSLKRVADGETSSKIYHDLRIELGDAENNMTHALKTMVNYYGDPTLSLFSNENDIIPELEDQFTPEEVTEETDIEGNSNDYAGSGCSIVEL